MNFEHITPIRLDEVDSTNAEAMRLLKRGKPAEGSCIVAAFQTEGRGQRSNSWDSAPAANLLSSFILYPRPFMAERPFLLSKTLALAVHKTLATLSTGHVQIKWPNDILIDGKKAAGILIENQWAGSNWQAAIAGIGINVNQTEFILEKATSLARQNGKLVLVDGVLKELQLQLSIEYARLCNEQEASINEDYHHELFGKEDYHLYQTLSGQLKAKVVRVADDGRLELISEKSELHSYDLNEVRLIY
jgi:BirA family biotin operon repressor/biotin-[acetyl-CoA-carboxylase] ligase